MEKKTRKSSKVEFSVDAVASNRLRNAAGIIHGNISAMTAFGTDEAPITYSVETRKALKDALAALTTLAPGLFKTQSRSQSPELKAYRAEWGKFLFTLKGMTKEERKKATTKWHDTHKMPGAKTTASKEPKK